MFVFGEGVSMWLIVAGGYVGGGMWGWTSTLFVVNHRPSWFLVMLSVAMMCCWSSVNVILPCPFRFPMWLNSCTLILSIIYRSGGMIVPEELGVYSVVQLSTVCLSVMIFIIPWPVAVSCCAICVALSYVLMGICVGRAW